ncbi:MAG: ABC transporter permease [candidate division NC10 bacterium]|nr:ABC transporter permease [candidate division NC10 bacterium]
MTRYLARRFWQSLLVLFGISLIVFIILHLTGDPAVLLMPPDATQEDIDNFRKIMGFNDPLFIRWPPWNNLDPPWRFLADTQYGRFFRGAILGDFGMSFRHQQPALGLVLERMPATIELTLAAMGLAVSVAVPVGILSAVRRNSAVDHAGMAMALLGQSMPVYWLGIMLIIKHGLRNAAIPVITVIGLDLGTLLGGAVITETIFAWPGVGRLAVQAIANRDYPVVQAAVFTLASIFVVINFLVDVLYTYVDPRVAYK